VWVHRPTLAASTTTRSRARCNVAGGRSLLPDYDFTNRLKPSMPPSPSSKTSPSSQTTPRVATTHEVRPSLECSTRAVNGRSPARFASVLLESRPSHDTLSALGGIGCPRNSFIDRSSPKRELFRGRTRLLRLGPGVLIGQELEDRPADGAHRFCSQRP